MRRFLTFCILFLTLTSTPDAGAQQLLPSLSGSSSEEARPSKEDIAEARNQVITSRQILMRAISKIKSDSPESPIPQHLTDELELLNWLELLYSNRDSAAQRKSELNEDLLVIDEEMNALRTFVSDGQPTSFLVLDDLRDQLHTERKRAASIQLEIDGARSSLEAARDAYNDSESKRRQTRETASESKEPNRLAKRNHRLAQLRSRALKEMVHQRETEREINELEHAVSTRRAMYLEERIASLGNNVHFSQEDLQEKIKVADVAEQDLRRQLAAVTTKLNDFERQWLASAHVIEEVSPEDPLAIERASMWRLLRELNQEQVGLLQRVVGYAGVVRSCWRRRFELVNDQCTPEDVLKWQKEFTTIREEITRFTRLVGIRADERITDLSGIRKRIFSLKSEADPLLPILERQVAELELAIHAYGTQMVLIKAATRTLDRFGQELAQTIEPNNAAEWLSWSRQLLTTCWNYEITSVDDRPITVSKLVWASCLLLLAIFVARIASRTLGNRVLPRLGLNHGAANAFQSIAFYVLLTCFCFFTLEFINLPLTVFAFMGGAIAIGVGFGSQNVLNNFISGLIMLAERPIRVGDLVDIDGLNGTIEHIGARSTRVRTGSNLEIIVPNSKFLENNVTNWTLSNTQIRTVVRVGVAYGSPTGQVRDLLREVVTNHEKVLDYPAPIILFKDFGDNSLLFEAHFWLNMRTMMDCERVCSDVRHEVGVSFEAANISIAFPQRDVHLDTLAPIEVNVRQLQDYQDALNGNRRAA